MATTREQDAATRKRIALITGGGYALVGIGVLAQVLARGRGAAPELALAGVFLAAAATVAALCAWGFRYRLAAPVLAAGLWAFAAGVAAAPIDAWGEALAAGAGAALLFGALPVFLYAPGSQPPWTRRAVAASLLVAPLAYSAGLSPTAWVALVVFEGAVAVAAALAWSAVGLRLARRLLLGYLYRPGLRRVRVARRPPRYPALTSRRVVKMAGVPFLFSLAVAALAGSVLTDGGRAEVATVVVLSNLVLVLGAPVAVPGTWIREALRVRVLDPETWVAERPTLPIYVGWLIGIPAVGILLRVVVSPPQLLSPSGVFGAVLGLVAIAMRLFPVAYAATLIYLALRGRRDLRRVVEEVDFEEAASLRELALRDAERGEATEGDP